MCDPAILLRLPPLMERYPDKMFVATGDGRQLPPVAGGEYFNHVHRVTDYLTMMVKGMFGEFIWLHENKRLRPE